LTFTSNPSVVFSRCAACEKFVCPRLASMLGAGMNDSSRRAIGLIRSCGIWLFANRVRPLPLMSPVNGS
jgi:hypothetical protein